MSDPLRDTVKRVAAELGTTLTFGYIGNCSPGGFDPQYPQHHITNYDDRLWMVWFHDFPRGEPFASYTNVPSKVLGRTSELPSPDVLELMIHDRFERLTELLAEREG